MRLGLGQLPDGARWGHIVGVGAVAGIGFTVSLFITGLAFDNEAIQDDAKIGTLIASVVAAIPVLSCSRSPAAASQGPPMRRRPTRMERRHPASATPQHGSLVGAAILAAVQRPVSDPHVLVEIAESKWPGPGSAHERTRKPPVHFADDRDS